ncbi:hypothetical protein NCCP2648_06080 [Lacticaseibacillus rhamnosus]|nr:hypothetical protein NCCP2648_06080 [Lacticaseibacillus rhamnosus]
MSFKLSVISPAIIDEVTVPEPQTDNKLIRLLIALTPFMMTLKALTSFRLCHAFIDIAIELHIIYWQLFCKHI